MVFTMECKRCLRKYLQKDIYYKAYLVLQNMRYFVGVTNNYKNATISNPSPLILQIAKQSLAKTL